MSLEINVWTVLLAAAITALATGLGALPFLVVKGVNEWWLSIFNAVAGGLMLAASHGLVTEGIGRDPLLTIVGMAVGLVVINLANRFIDHGGTPEVADLSGDQARKALLILGIMTAHSFAEGIGVGVSYGGGERLGVFITSAIAIHNIPEGIAISLILVPRGTPVWKAAGWSVFSSLPQPLMAVPAFLFVLVFEPWLPLGLGLAGGAMIWMVMAEILPEAQENASGAAVGTAVVLAFLALLAVQELLL
jgi:zinc transporter ZupT